MRARRPTPLSGSANAAFRSLDICDTCYDNLMCCYGYIACCDWREESKRMNIRDATIFKHSAADYVKELTVTMLMYHAQAFHMRNAGARGNMGAGMYP
jgi:hypothetical protein